ncbi:Crp/Fnr family transcriptional regulator [Urechidicola croceus]|uniref:Transcriptional regulator n=1 Tax=Urechidicola croceus TaxID=1850246 RepID=A0A1D8P724_9FLAO|nr:Crp/Fnr family transcriptional regulator [Urechidicola croceus]AOW20357.1 transcriptional regulator [Urechidicola croceus]
MLNYNVQNTIFHYLDKISLINNNVSKNYLFEIQDSITIIQCKKGQQFVMEGAPVNGLFFICKGRAKVLKTGIYGKEQILRFVKEGEIVGHRGFGTRKKYGISAVALEDIVLCNFSNEVLEKMLKEIPTLTYNLMLFYAEELNKSENKVKAFAQMTVKEKVIDTLIYLHRKFGQNPKGYLNLVLSRKEIADFAGTSDEQVIRILSTLKKENQIFTSGKRIGISNIDLLKKEISEHNYFINS